MGSHSIPYRLTGLVAWMVAAATISASLSMAHEEYAGKLAEDISRRRLARDTKTYTVKNAADLISSLELERNNNDHRVDFILPTGTLVFDKPLILPMAATIQGVRGNGGSPATVLRCGSAGMDSLFEFHGSQLYLSDVQLEGCNCPGLRINSSMSATIVIEDSVFKNFTYTLEAGRVDLLAPDALVPITDSTAAAALAVHASNFTGNFTVRDTKFIGNAFLLHPVERRLLEEADGDGPGDQADLTASKRNFGGHGHITSSGGLNLLTSATTLTRKHHRRRGMSVAATQPDSLLDAVYGNSWDMIANGRHNPEHRRPKQRRQLVESEAGKLYSMPYLESAKTVHPDLKAGPFEDDMQTVFAVLCRQNHSCNISFNNVTISNNTGVATGALYVLCDGSESCAVELVGCTVTNNRLLWQPATDRGEEPNRQVTEKQMVNRPDDDYDYEVEVKVAGPGTRLLWAMTPWLTYTYPLLTSFQEPSQEYATDDMRNAAKYPTVTGRTLGAVVLHQRNSPVPGVSSSAQMTVRVASGTYNGNDGAAIMSTATDFMEIAGGDSAWSGGPPRHSADISITNVTVTDHSSGWPAIWLRWARAASISKCQISNSTGAVWLDEVRDKALVEDSSFTGNKLNQLWLDYISFLAWSQDSSAEFNLGAPTSHVVKIQMTPLGGVVNEATVRNCRFKGNPSSTTGVLYIRASDVSAIDKDVQPGRTEVVVSDTTFANNTCRWSPEPCLSAERPLYIPNVYKASVQTCRFIGNFNGGIYFDSVYQANVDTNSVFESNQMTYNLSDAEGGDNSYGGAAVFAWNVGGGGIHIADTEFRSNMAVVGGGAVYVRSFDFIRITSSLFVFNTAQSFDGGAVWMENAIGTSSMVLQGNDFVGNTAGRNGGALSASNIAPGKQVGMEVSGCTFTDNVALINPAERGLAVLDQAGGGAIFASSAGLQVQGCKMSGNKVLGHAGGALRVVDSVALTVIQSVFKDNVAIMGGALAVSRLRSCTVRFSTFINNTVVHPWAWPDTTPVVVSSTSKAPVLSFIDPGYGGAIYAFSAEFLMQTNGSFIGNSAKYGGAISVISSPSFMIQPGTSKDIDTSPISYEDVPSEIAEAAGMPVKSPKLPYRYLFAENSALIGGAVYMYDTDSIVFNLTLRQRVYNNAARSFVITEESGKVLDHPAILFYKNLANGGGAMYLEGNGQANITMARFAANNASVPPLFGNFAGLYGRERDYATAKAHPCYNGGGGAMCVVGQANKKTVISSSDMINNSAKDGAAIYVAEGLDCILQAGCYQVVLSLVNITGNNATSRGGGIFWTHESVLQVASCSTDKSHVFATDGRALFGLPTTSTVSQSMPYNITLITPGRKGPANSYRQLTMENQNRLLSTVGGPTNTSASPLQLVNGSLTLQGRAVFVNSVSPNATVLNANQQIVAARGAFLTNEGNVVLPNSNSAIPAGWIPIDAVPVIVNGTAVDNPDWLGIPYVHLPCANWRNSAGTGSDISSTPYFLMNPHRLDFYTSNTDIKFNVTVHDWLGQPCVGDSSTQPLVIVQADSTEVSGAVTIPAFNGSADFSSLRLRAREGLHNVSMTGLLYSPFRELLEAEVQIYVRPCAINEFLSPKNLDECIPCDPSSYNLNVSSVTCQPCPDNANCAYPDPTACKSDDSCNPVGFMVPEDGYWHVSFFSEEVIECPNPDSCTSTNRSSLLSQIQLRVWQAARQIQLNASNTVADQAALAAYAHLLSSMRGRRLLQEKAISDEDDITQVLLATAAYLPEYQQTQCAEGYTGTLCGECMPGYGWRKIATCGKCPSRALNNLYYALVTLLTLSLLAFTIYSSLKEQQMPGKLVGGVTDKGKNKASRHNPSAGHGIVQSSSPSAGAAQYQAMLAAATAAGSLPIDGMGILHDNTHSQLPEGEPIAFDYMDPVVAAARGHYASAPGTPKGRAAPPQPFPNFEAALRAHSVLGVPMRRPQWSPRDDQRKASPPWSRFEQGNGSYTSAPGPVAEGTDYTNILYDDRGVEIPRGETSDVPHEVQAAECDQGATGESFSQPVVPPGVMLQSVPLMQGSPTQTPRQHMNAPPVGVDHQSAAERSQAAEEARRRTLYARQRAHQSTVVKIFVSYVQVLALLQNVPLDIPGVVDVYYRINNQAISYPGILVSLDCSLSNDSGVSKAFVRVILTVLAPLYIFAGSVIYFILFNILDYYVIMPYYAKRVTKKRRKRHLRMPTFAMHLDTYLGRQLIVTFITIFFFFYPSVVQSLMTIFNCVDVNSLSTVNPLAAGLGLQTDRVWSQDFALECYVGPHLALTLGLGLPGVLLIAIGWPLMSALLMTGKLPFMNNIRFTEDMTEFFLADFKSKYAWWESVVMLRKLFIAVIVTLVDGPTSPGVQLLLVICVLVIATGIQLAAMPYHHMYTNNLELFSLGTLLTTLYLSLYFGFSSSISDGGRITISVLILAVNVSMVAVFVYYIIQAYWYAALYSTGLSDLDRETRRKLTAAELQRRILENLTSQGSTTSYIQDGGHEQRTSYHHVASIYAAAVWASMRVGSTTNKVLTRVRTMLDHDIPPLSRPPSRDGSEEGGEIQAIEDDDSGAHAVHLRSSRDGNAIIEEDPEAGLGGSGSNSKRSSHAGTAPLERNSAVLGSLSSQKAGNQAATTSASRSSSFGATIKAVPVSANPVDDAGASPSSRAALQSVSRESSVTSIDHPRLPTFPMGLDADQPANSAPATSAPAVTSSGAPRQVGPRAQSRLAVGSGQTLRSGELLPPPPTFMGAFPSQRKL